MHAFHILTTLESEHLILPQLRPLIGKQVEITVREAEDEHASGQSLHPLKERYPLRGSVLRYDDPFAPAVDAEEWEAGR